MTERVLGPPQGRRRRRLSFTVGLLVSLTFVGVLGCALLLLSGRPLMGTDSTDLPRLLTARSLDVAALGVQHPFSALLEQRLKANGICLKGGLRHRSISL